MKAQFIHWYKILLILGLIAILGFAIQGSASAAQVSLKLTVIPLTWNVVGLDSNNPTQGPTIYPVGVKVCNNTGSVATNVGSQLVWTSSNDYIALRAGSLTSFSGYTLAPGDCENFYYEIQVQTTPNPGDTLNDIYDSSRRFYINATATGFAEATTVKPQEIFVEHLVSQNRNSVTNVILDSDTSVPAGGSMTLLVGETYDIELVGNTATNGYEQIESYINFPNTIFQINSVTTSYSAKPDSNPDLDPLWAEKPYANGCTWVNDPTSPNYRSCLGTGKYGGSITVSYNVTIIGGGGTTQHLNTLIYDFSGSSYHYNSDYAVGSRLAIIVDPISSLGFSKSFSPTSLTPPGTSRLTFTITNPTSVPLSDLHFTDTLPASPAQMSVAATPDYQLTGCGSLATSSADGTGNTLTFAGGEIAGGGTCTLGVNVQVLAAPATGTYLNSSGPLFVGTINTNKTASASLTLASDGTGMCGQTMANWTFAGWTTNPPPQPAPAIIGTGVTSAVLSVGNGLIDVPDSFTGGTPGGNPIPGIKTYGWPKTGPINTATGPYIQFAIDTYNYSEVKLRFDAQRKNNGPSSLGLYYSTDGTTWALHTNLAPTTGWLTYPGAGSDYDFTGLTSTTGVTYFRIYGYGANAVTVGNDLSLDNVIFSGCGAGLPPTLSKAFQTDPIGLNGSSALQFTLTNPNTSTLTGVQFADTLPAGLTVPTAGPTLLPACGNGTLQTTAPSLIQYSGGTLAASGSCTFDVTVTGTAAETHVNTSGFISSIESGTNTDPAAGRGTDALTVLLPPTITKLFGPNPMLSGGTSTLTFTITNPNTDYDMNGVSFTDDFPSGMTSAAAPAPAQCGGAVSSTAGSVSLTGGHILRGDSCTVSIVVTTGAVLVSTTFENTSGNVADTSAGTGNTASAALTVNPVTPRLHLSKMVSTSATGPWSPFVTVTPGTNVYYQFTVENTGDVPIAGVTISDPTVKMGLCSILNPLPVAVADPTNYDHIGTCSAGPVAAAAGETPNTAVASGTYNGNPVDSNPASASVLAVVPGFSLVKQVGLSASGPWASTISGVPVNTPVYYRFLISNTGATAIWSLSISDPQVNTAGCTFTDPLPVGAATACVVGPVAGLAAPGSKTNTATAQGESPVGTLVDSNSSSATYAVSAAPTELTVTKSHGAVTPTQDVPFTWSLQVSNGVGAGEALFGDGQTILSDLLPPLPVTSAVTLSGISNVTNPGNISCSIAAGTLRCSASGGSVTIAAGGGFTASFDVTPDTTGTFTNTATVDPLDAVNESDETNNTGADSVDVQLGTPGMTVTKDADRAGVDAAGQVITYTVIVTNTGTTLLTGVSVSDPLLTDLDCDPVTAGYQTSGLTIPYGGALTCTGTYTVLQADIDNNGGGDGDIDNTATASAKGLTDENAMAFVPITRNPALTLAKSGTFVDGDSDGFADAGETITYTFTVTNTGNVTLTNVTVTDPKVTVTGGPITLTPGASDATTFTGTYAITQADIDAGSVYNLATADSTESGPATGENTTALLQNPALTLAKSGTWVDGDGDGFADAGETITYTFTVTNTGNVTLTGVTVTDPKVTVVGGPITLAPGAEDTTTFTGAYTLTQADVDAGSVYNMATADSTESGPATAENTTTLLQYPVLTLAKTGTWTDGDGDGLADAGETITYAFTVTNTGNVTLHNVTVTDPMVTVVGGPILTLAPGASDATTFTGTYVISQADINAGQVLNTATADSTESGPAPDDETTGLPQNPELTLVKSVTETSYAAVDDILHYSFQVTNSGNVRLADPVTIDDDKATDESCPGMADGFLDPGESITCTATYTIVQADLNLGHVTNVASASAGKTTSNTDSKTVNGAGTPALSLSKSGTWADGDGDGFADAGETITYIFTVTNTGNVTLTGVTVTDPKVTVVGGPITLAPGASDATTFTGTYAITQADIGAGSVYNLATADSTESGPATGENTTTLLQNPVLTLAKSVTETGYSAVGDILHYRFSVTNDGNVSLAAPVTIDDDQATDESCPGIADGFLDPGDSIICTATYAIEQADLDAGSVTNIASASADGVISNTDTETVNGAGTPAFTITKDADVATVDAAGDVIHYTITLTNTGTATLTGVTIDDPVLSGLACTPAQPADLAPGEAITCNSSYTVTQVDIDGGDNINNTATGNSNELGPQNASESVQVLQNRGLGLVKSASPATYDAVGDIINYGYVVTNTGDVTLTDSITVTDDKATVTCPALPAGGLAPGEDITCTATYEITQDDLNWFEVTNTATAHSGNLASNEATRTVTANQNPDIRITKRIEDTEFESPRLIHVTYSFLVENVGNVFLGRIQVVDDLRDTFAGAASFTVEQLSSSDFTVNTHYNGRTDTNLLDESDFLDPGESGTIMLKVLVDTGGDGDLYTNLATASGMTPGEDYVHDQDEASGPTFVDPVVTKAVDPSLASIGDTVTYTITVSNNGSMAAADVIVTDILPPYLDLVPGGVTLTPNLGTINITPPRTVTVTLPTVAINDTFIIRIRTIVNSLGNPITNQVQLSTNTPNGWQGNLLINDRAAANLRTEEDDDDGGGEPLVGRQLPSTGFAPGVMTTLPEQPSGLEYAQLGNVWVEIPSLNVKASIVGVPSTDKGWNTTWLWNEAGWLDGTAFPGWAGNSVLTAHVYLSNGKPGPFVDLSKLKWGEKIIVHAYGEKYTFEVRQNDRLQPSDSSVLKHEEYSWLTLLTCNSFNPKTYVYDYRIAVRAVLVKAESE